MIHEAHNKQKYLLIIKADKLMNKVGEVYTIKEFDTLKKAVGYMLSNNLMANTFIAKSIPDYEVIELNED